MSLDNILDDIKEDVENIAQEELPLNANSQPKDNSTPKVIYLKYDKVSDSLRTKIDTLTHLLTVKEQVSTMNKVDKSMALEVFTMLPNITKTEEAKLTSAPSVINKEILNKILDKETDKKPLEELYSSLGGIAEGVTNLVSQTEFVINRLREFNEALAPKLEKLKATPPIVVIDSSNVNLLEVSIASVSSSVHIYDYKKYDEDFKLNKLFKALYKDLSLDEYIKSKEYLSLATVNISDLLHSLAQDYSLLVEGNNKLTNFNSRYLAIKDNNLVVNELASLLELSDDVCSILNKVSMLYAILSNDDNFVAKLEELICFLD